MSTIPPPDTELLLKWADDALASGVGGLMLYDAHLGQLGGGLEVCKQLRNRLG